MSVHRNNNMNNNNNNNKNNSDADEDDDDIHTETVYPCKRSRSDRFLSMQPSRSNDHSNNRFRLSNPINMDKDIAYFVTRDNKQGQNQGTVNNVHDPTANSQLCNSNTDYTMSTHKSNSMNLQRYRAIQKWVKDECKRGELLKKEKIKKLKSEAQMARIEAKKIYEDRLQEIRHIQHTETNNIEKWYRTTHAQVIQYERSISDQYIQSLT